MGRSPIPLGNDSAKTSKKQDVDILLKRHIHIIFLKNPTINNMLYFHGQYILKV